jgi:hypothetical protein
MASIVVWIRNWLTALTFPVKKVTVFFILTGPEEWVAYVEEMPAINSWGSSAAGALDGLIKELKQYDSGTWTLTRITHYKYLRTYLPFSPF